MDRREGTSPRRQEDSWTIWDKRIRDSIIFIVGVAGTLHELFIVADPRIVALVFLGGLIGIPFVLPDNFKRDNGK